jgi:CDGSH-type Zn-finger protein
MHIWDQSETNIVERQDQLKEKPKMLPLSNGPYYLLNDMVPKIVKNLQNSEGGPLSTIRRVALYSCGDSDNKPFCDGTHAIIGFSSKNKETLDGNSVLKIKEKIMLVKNNKNIHIIHKQVILWHSRF